MRLRIYKIKAIVALILVLCLGMPFLLSTATAMSVADHEHVCSEEGYKDACADVRECCKICLNFYNAKARLIGLYGSMANRLAEQPELPSSYSVTELAYFGAVCSTLVSLNVRLNN